MERASIAWIVLIMSMFSECSCGRDLACPNCDKSLFSNDTTELNNRLAQLEKLIAQQKKLIDKLNRRLAGHRNRGKT